MVSAGIVSLPRKTPLGLSALMMPTIGFSCPRTQTSSANRGEPISRLPTTAASSTRNDMGGFLQCGNLREMELLRALPVGLLAVVLRLEPGLRRDQLADQRLD